MERAGAPSAKTIAPLLVERYRPRSVVDVGCGAGYFLDAFRNCGVTRRLGVDGPFNNGHLVRERGHDFVAVDLQAQKLSVGRFDLALCLEVAEHLPAERASALVEGLIETAAVVAFSAAVPRQLGEGHVHLRPQSFWASLFAEHDFIAHDVVRPVVWSDDNVSWWYAQNLLVYSAGHRAETMLLDVIHPRFLDALIELTRRNPSGRASLMGLSAAARKRLPSLPRWRRS